MHSSYEIISISRSASIDAASSEISLFLSDYRRKRVCTARPCCCMTNGSRCALPVCHKPHMTHPSDTAMHARRLREPLQYILWQYRQHTVTPPLDFPQEAQTSTARAVCSRCVLSLSTDTEWVYTVQTLDGAVRGRSKGPSGRTKGPLDGPLTPAKGAFGRQACPSSPTSSPVRRRLSSPLARPY